MCVCVFWFFSKAYSEAERRRVVQVVGRIQAAARKRCRQRLSLERVVDFLRARSSCCKTLSGMAVRRWRQLHS